MKAKKFIKYMLYRQRNLEQVVPFFRQAGLFQLANEIQGCGVSVRVLVCERCGTKHFGGFFRCKRRWCILCSWYKAAMEFARLVPVIEQMMSEGYYFSFMTFTVKSIFDLARQRQVVEDSFRRLYQVRQFRKRFCGYVSAVELTFSAEYGWHYHMHILLASKEWGKDYEWISEEWKRIVNDIGSLSASVDVKGVKGGIKGLVEVLKYLIVSDELVKLPCERAVELVNVYKGLRQYRVAGEIRKRLLNDEAEACLDDLEEIVRFVCQRCGYDRSYVEYVLFQDLVASKEVLFDVVKDREGGYNDDDSL